MKRDPWRDAKGLLQEGNELQVLPFSSHLAPIRDAVEAAGNRRPSLHCRVRPPTFWPEWRHATSPSPLWCARCTLA